jgi:hypothetical protein
MLPHLCRNLLASGFSENSNREIRRRLQFLDRGLISHYGLWRAEARNYKSTHLYAAMMAALPHSLFPYFSGWERRRTEVSEV